MYKFLAYMTRDCSVGLYNDNFDDIYHSAFGALNEAFDKFIIPISNLDIFSKNNDIEVLDICYGIGYNSKAFIDMVLKNKFKNKINIDCVDTDKILIELSPFISSRINFFQRIFFKKKLYENISSHQEAKKIILSNPIKLSKYKLSSKTSKIILKNIIENFGFDFLSNDSKNILSDFQNRVFFDLNLTRFYKFLLKNKVYLHKKDFLSSSVHNIYYKYVSNRNNLSEFFSNNTRVHMNFYDKDIRNHLNSTNKKYNIVLLDGFTPSKCPCIWSLDFFNRLRELIDINGVLVTYNTSAPVRNAMKSAGFFIGNTFDKENKIIGTIASLNPELIINKLTAIQEGLLKTKAGIPYRDNNLLLDNDTILLNREAEINNSNLITSSKYYKGVKNGI